MTCLDVHVKEMFPAEALAVVVPRSKIIIQMTVET